MAAYSKTPTSRPVFRPQLIYRLLGYAGLAALAVLSLRADVFLPALSLLVFSIGWPCLCWGLLPWVRALGDVHAPGAAALHAGECLLVVVLVWWVGMPDWLVIAVGLLSLSGVTALGGSRLLLPSAVSLSGFVLIALPWREGTWLADSVTVIGGTLSGACLLGLAWQAHLQARRLNADRRQALSRSDALADQNTRLSRYLPEALAPADRTGPLYPQVPTEVFATVAFLDLVGFAELVAGRSISEVVDVLNDFMSTVSRLTSRHGGELGKFLGDGVLVYFAEDLSGADRHQSTDRVQAAAGCVRLVLALGGALDELSRNWHKRGLGLALEVRVGVASGYCALGDLGGKTRLDYTLIGTPVNLASRLQAVAMPGEIMVSSATASLIGQVPELTAFVGSPRRLTLKGLGVVVVHELNGSAKVRAILPAVEAGEPDARE